MLGEARRPAPAPLVARARPEGRVGQIAESRGAAQHSEWQFYNTLSLSAVNRSAQHFFFRRVCLTALTRQQQSSVKCITVPEVHWKSQGVVSNAYSLSAISAFALFRLI